MDILTCTAEEIEYLMQISWKISAADGLIC